MAILHFGARGGLFRFGGLYPKHIRINHKRGSFQLWGFYIRINQGLGGLFANEPVILMKGI